MLWSQSISDGRQSKISSRNHQRKLLIDLFFPDLLSNLYYIAQAHLPMDCTQHSCLGPLNQLAVYKCPLRKAHVPTWLKQFLNRGFLISLQLCWSLVNHILAYQKPQILISNYYNNSLINLPLRLHDQVCFISSDLSIVIQVQQQLTKLWSLSGFSSPKLQILPSSVPRHKSLIGIIAARLC